MLNKQLADLPQSDDSNQPAAQVASAANDAENRYSGLFNSSIMVVDDEPINIEIAQMFLEESGYQSFVTTSDSTQAIGLLKEKKPDVVLLDLMMPQVSGFDILTEMQADPKLRYIPVVILTSSDGAETKLKALELGATDFLAKPVDPSELSLRMRNTLAAKAYQDRLAYYDGLTGLANRDFFMERMDWSTQVATREKHQCAVLCLDLDGFKKINDTLGLEVGDEVLKECANRLKDCIRRSDMLSTLVGTDSENLSRIGGDEFAVLLHKIEDGESASIAAKRMLKVADDPYVVDGHEVFLSPNVGISVFPDDGTNGLELLKHAEVAVQSAKEHGRNTFQFYSNSLNALAIEKLKMENLLRRAVEREELQLYYQPKLNVNSGLVTGAEALLRWFSPELGMVSPANFVPLAEETGLILPIGDWIIQEAFRQNQEWHQAGFDGFKLAINLSSEQFRKGDLVEIVRERLDLTGANPGCLTLELTEGTVMEDAETNIEMLHQLKGMGFNLSVDDFGTGYSSLSYLRRFPLDELKIDQSFVSEVHSDQDAAAIVDAIILLSHSLGLKVVAEGVEIEAQAEYLRNKQCDEFQGFLYAKPMPAEELTAMLEHKAD